MLFPSASETGMRQEATLLPFMSTVQARHCPSPQPYFVPLNCRSSRNTSNNGRCGSVATVRDCPLTVKRKLVSILRVLVKLHITTGEIFDQAERRSPGLRGVKMVAAEVTRRTVARACRESASLLRRLRYPELIFLACSPRERN